MATTARRELEEETGWSAKKLKRLITFYAAPGVLSEQMTLYLATDLHPVPARPEPDECVEPVILTHAQALAKLRSGHICDAKTIIGVLLASSIHRKADIWHM
jgi:ADP-ribose pyrophosphatase